MSGAKRNVGIPTGHRQMITAEFLQYLNEIDPTVKASNSRNLKCWMVKYGRPGDSVFSLSATSRLVSTFPEGTLFIGQPYNDYPADNDFSGALFMEVLCLWGHAVRIGTFPRTSHQFQMRRFWGGNLYLHRRLHGHHIKAHRLKPIAIHQRAIFGRYVEKTVVL